MKTLLIGNGYVGSRIAKIIPGLFHIIGRGQDIEKAILSYVPAVIFNCAGYSGIPNVDACEEERERTLRDNLVLPGHLSYLCEKYDIILAHVSSGCLYMGGPFAEDHPPNFSGSFYSLTKLLAEEVVRKWRRHYNLRIRMPFSGSDEAKNLLVKLRSYPKLVNYTNSISHIDDACHAMVRLVYDGRPFGTYNIVNPGAITTEEIADMMGLRKYWMHPTAFRAMVKAPRSECTLDSSKALKYVGLRPVREALTESIQQLYKGDA